MTQARLQASPSPAQQTPAALAAREEVSGVRLLPKRWKSHGASSSHQHKHTQQEEAAARLILPSEERRLKRARAKRTDAQEPGLEVWMQEAPYTVARLLGAHHHQPAPRSGTACDSGTANRSALRGAASTVQSLASQVIMRVDLPTRR